MTREISIVDHGRGPQLSTCRITVQDLVPYLQQEYTHEQIREIMPVLTSQEIAVVERYVQEHFEAVMEEDRSIRERIAARRKPPEVEEAEYLASMKRLDRVRQMIQNGGRKPNGDHTACR